MGIQDIGDLVLGWEFVAALPVMLLVAVISGRLLGVRTIAERGDLRASVSLFGDSEDVRVLTRLLNRVVLAFLGGVVGLILVILIGVMGGPEFTGQTSLYEFFGYFGLFCSTVLVLRVLVALLRDGLN